MQLQKGANAEIDSNIVEISWHTTPGKAEVDVSAYLLTGERKVEGDAGMVFYGQRSVPGANLTIYQEQRAAVFEINPATLPATIETIAFCVALDTSHDQSRRLADVGALKMQMGSNSFEIPLAGMSEQALIICEVYKRNGTLKVRAVGQGFNGGLAPLAINFGVDVEGANEQAPTPVSAPSTPVSAVSLKKVTLAKNERVSLSKATGSIRAKLKWEGRGKGEGDLDATPCLVLTAPSATAPALSRAIVPSSSSTARMAARSPCHCSIRTGPPTGSPSPISISIARS
jgi:tellurite resistance protein TerA